MDLQNNHAIIINKTMTYTNNEIDDYLHEICCSCFCGCLAWSLLPPPSLSLFLSANIILFHIPWRPSVNSPPSRAPSSGQIKPQLKRTCMYNGATAIERKKKKRQFNAGPGTNQFELVRNVITAHTHIHTISISITICLCCVYTRIIHCIHNYWHFKLVFGSHINDYLL